MINLFTTTASLESGGILTLEKSKTVTKDGPQSVFSIAKNFNLEEVFNVESKLTSFFEGVLNAREEKIKFNFGLKIYVGPEVDVSSYSFAGDSAKNKIIIFANNDEGYNDLVKIFSKSISIGSINRVSYSILKKYWSRNLQLAIPFYDSYIYRNNVEFGCAVPDFPTSDIVYFTENNSLPMDRVVFKKLKELGLDKQAIPVQTCYYSKSADFKKFMVYRCMLAGTTFNKPNIENFASDSFYPKIEKL